MRKEIIIVCIVVIAIIILNIITSKNTSSIMDEEIAYLGLVREGIEVESEEQMKENIEKVKETWNKEKKILSLYIEHDELEKVEMYVTNVNTNIEIKEYNRAIEALDTCTFIINHIKDKYKLSIVNIF